MAVQLMLCLRRLGKDDEAREQEKAVEELGKDLERMSALTAALQERPDDPDLRCRIGEVFLRRGEEQEGLRWLNGVLESYPDWPAAHQTAPPTPRAARPTAEAARTTACRAFGRPADQGEQRQAPDKHCDGKAEIGA